MTDRQILAQQLIEAEGLKLKPYADTAGKVSIGVGRNLSDVGISSQEAMTLLDHDVDAAIADLETFTWFQRLDPVRQRAVINLRFNVGPLGFRSFQKFIHAMAVANYREAAFELISSRWATQVGARAREVADRIATGME